MNFQLETPNVVVDWITNVLEGRSASVICDPWLFYYSGHGIASAGENYLIPVDVEEPSTVELNVQGVRHSEVLSILRNEAPNAAHYLVLDACRNTLQGARGGKGFVPLGQQSGVLVAFAAEPGKTASDTGAGSGPYAAALAAELVKPGQNDLLMFHNVRVAVMDKTRGDQVPWTEDGIQRRQRVLFGGEIKTAPVPPQAQTSEPERLGQWIKNMNDQSLLESLVRTFGDTPTGALAKARLDELKRQQVAVATSPPTPLTSPQPKATPAAPCTINDIPEVPDTYLLFCRTMRYDLLGLTISWNEDTKTGGVIVDNLDNASDAAQKGIKAGDVILEISALSVKDPMDVADAIRAATKLGRKAVLMRIKSGSEIRFVPVTLKNN